MPSNYLLIGFSLALFLVEMFAYAIIHHVLKGLPASVDFPLMEGIQRIRVAHVIAYAAVFLLVLAFASKVPPLFAFVLTIQIISVCFDFFLIRKIQNLSR
jgi:hypothetical protein